MRPIRGVYFDGKTGAGVSALVRVVVDRVDGTRLEVVAVKADASDDGEADSPLASVALSDCRVSPRIGSTARSLELPGGAIVQSDDHAGLDLLERELGGAGALRLVHWLEKAWPAALGALVVIVLAGWGLYAWGLPWAAKRVAFALPDGATEKLSDGSFQILETLLSLEESGLSDVEQASLRTEFNDVARFAGAQRTMRLHFRSGSGLANAFALPAGDIIVTDELVAAAEDPREVVAVLAHEAGHIVERHAVRSAIENAGMLFVLGAVLGDVGSVSSLAGALPTILAEANYQQAHEREADDFAADYCLDKGWDPRLLGRILSAMAGAESLPAETLWSSHPTLAERLRHLEDRAATR